MRAVPKIGTSGRFGRFFRKKRNFAPKRGNTTIRPDRHFSNCVPNCVPRYATAQEAEPPDAAGTRSSKNTNRPPQDAIEMESLPNFVGLLAKVDEKGTKASARSALAQVAKTSASARFFLFSSLGFFKCFHGQGRLLGRCIRWDTVWDTV